MQDTKFAERIAVCSWSVQATTIEQLISQLRNVGINKVQLALDPLRSAPNRWIDTAERLEDEGISVVSGMVGSVGEDYSTLETIRRTGGVVPDATWPATWTNIQKTVPIAARLGLKLVTFHAGFLPHDPNDPLFAKVLGRVKQVAEAFGAEGIELGFETGQEDAHALKQFLETLPVPNVCVNFDPANMLLYGSGNPIEALSLLGPYVKQCHIKDARRAAVPGTWGTEEVVGTGEVDWPSFFRVLRDINFGGYLVIERESGNQRVEDIKRAKDFIIKTASAIH